MAPPIGLEQKTARKRRVCEPFIYAANETESGRIEYVYDFFEFSEKDDTDAEQGNNEQPINKVRTFEAKADSPESKKQEAEKQGIENLPLENQAVENQGQSKTNNKILRNKQSINQSSHDGRKQVRSAVPSEDRPIDRYSNEFEAYSDLVKSNIDFIDFADWLENEEEAEEIVQMIVRQICSAAPYERICNQQFPREVI